MTEEDIFSNLAIIPFSLAGFTWYSAEQFFQAAKFTDDEIIEKIKVSVMEQAIRARFEQHPELAKALKLTKRKLYDHSAADNFWGIGVDGHGTNMTGEILMKIRRELQNADE